MARLIRENLQYAILLLLAVSSDGGPIEVVALVRLLLLAADSGLLPAGPRNTSPVVGVLRPVSDILLTINSHAYMAPAKADRALQLLTTVLQVHVYVTLIKLFVIISLKQNMKRLAFILYVRIIDNTFF